MVLQNLWQRKIVYQQCIISPSTNGHTYILNCENMKNDPCELVSLLLSSTHLPLTKSILFSPRLSHPLCVRQLFGLLPVKLHERTGGCTFLLSIALHSGDSLPCLTSLGPLFVSVHFCTEASSSGRGLHSCQTHSSLYAPFLFRVITERMQYFWAEMQ